MMNESKQPFYLGEKKQAEPQESQEKSGISYGGAMPEALANYRPRTNEEVARARILSEKYEKKNMIFRRILYLERKRQEILGYMLDASKKKRSLRSLLGLDKEDRRQRERSRKLYEMKLEHDKLVAEKEKLEAEIKEMEKAQHE